MKQIIQHTLFILVRRERRKLLLFMAAGAVISVVDIVFLAMLIFIVGVYTKTGIAMTFNGIVPLSRLNPDAVSLALAFLIFFMLKNSVAFVLGYTQYRFIYQVALRIARGNLVNYLEGPYQEYTGVDSSVHIRKISQQPIEFCHYILTGLLEIFTELMIIILTISAILWYDSKLFLLLLIILLPAVLALSYFSRKKLKTARLHIKTTAEKTLQHLTEALAGYMESNIYDKKSFFCNRYIRNQARLNKYLSDLRIIQKLPSRFIEIFAVAGFFILVVIHHVYQNENAVSLVTIGAFSVAVYKIIPGIAKILNISGQIRAYQFTTEDLVKGQRKVKREVSSSDPAEIHSIEFRDVSFQYPNSSSSLLNSRHVHFCLNAGDFIGITGTSGKGKTTILNLLLGFIEPAGGAILINDEIAITQERQRFRTRMAYSRQQSFLIHDSILKNILLSETPAEEHRLSEVIQATGLSELLNRFPDGLHHVITENGKNISGGQRKRISLARTLYKNADVIILDEPFNELDEAAGCAIRAHLERLAQSGKMIIMVTHDAKSLSVCHKVISLDVHETKGKSEAYSPY